MCTCIFYFRQQPLSRYKHIEHSDPILICMRDGSCSLATAVMPCHYFVLFRQSLFFAHNLFLYLFSKPSCFGHRGVFLERKNGLNHRINESMLDNISAEKEIAATARKRKLQYFDHIVRTQNLCTYIFESRLDGTRSRGRPRRRWSDDITGPVRLAK